MAEKIRIGASACLLGYFKRELSADEKQELLELFEQYRRGGCR